jgi:hypothetical protein
MATHFNRSVNRTLIVALALASSISLSCCNYLTDRVVESANSPDHKVVAILIERNVSAVTDTIYLVYIMPKGSSSRGALVMSGENFEDLKFAWNKDRVLDLYFSKGNISSFRNFWRDPSNTQYIVEIRLKPTTDYPLNSRYL